MIKNIIFDLGDVFINLNQKVLHAELKQWDKEKAGEFLEVCTQLEVGTVEEGAFIRYLAKHYPNKSKQELICLWNSMISDFPLQRLIFLEKLSGKFNLVLLSNTNQIHIDYFKDLVGEEFYSRFTNCFEAVYYSHQIKMRKPNPKFFQFVLSQMNWGAKDTLFVDDNAENIDAAKNLGLETWLLKVGEEDVMDLYQKKIL